MNKRTVAIIGASTDRSKFGNKAVRAYIDLGWDVYPVNPKGGTIEGLKVYTAIEDVPGELDRVALYLPPKLGIQALAGIAAIEPDELFVNPGAESPELIDQARALGLDPIQACAIVDIGTMPGEYAD